MTKIFEDFKLQHIYNQFCSSNQILGFIIGLSKQFIRKNLKLFLPCSLKPPRVIFLSILIHHCVIFPLQFSNLSQITGLQFRVQTCSLQIKIQEPHGAHFFLWFSPVPQNLRQIGPRVRDMKGHTNKQANNQRLLLYIYTCYKFQNIINQKSI